MMLFVNDVDLGLSVGVSDGFVRHSGSSYLDCFTLSSSMVLREKGLDVVWSFRSNDPIEKGFLEKNRSRSERPQMRLSKVSRTGPKIKVL